MSQDGDEERKWRRSRPFIVPLASYLEGQRSIPPTTTNLKPAHWRWEAGKAFLLTFLFYLYSISASSLLHCTEDRTEVQKEGGDRPDSNPWHAVTCCISHLIFHIQPVDIVKGKAEWKHHQTSNQCAGQCPSSPAKHRCCVPICILFLYTFSIYCSCSYKVRTVASNMHTIGPYYFVMMTLCLELWPACSNIPRSPLQSVY